MASGSPVTAEFDWRQAGPQTWDITIQSDEGPVVLSQGGSQVTADGGPRIGGEDREYRNLYSTFVALVGKGTSDVDLSPLVHVADAFLLGRHRRVDPFG